MKSHIKISSHNSHETWRYDFMSAKYSVAPEGLQSVTIYIERYQLNSDQ